MNKEELKENSCYINPSYPFKCLYKFTRFEYDPYDDVKKDAYYFEIVGTDDTADARFKSLQRLNIANMQPQ